jgi:hypothetical protein
VCSNSTSSKSWRSGVTLPYSIVLDIILKVFYWWSVVKRLFSENVDLAQMAKTKIIFGKKKSRFGEKKAFLVIKKIGVSVFPPLYFLVIKKSDKSQHS